MPFPSRYNTRQDRGFCMGEVHCNTPYLVHMPTDPQKGKKQIGIIVLFIIHAIFFRKISKTEFQGV